MTRSFRDAPAALVKANEEREAERLARDLLLQEEPLPGLSEGVAMCSLYVYIDSCFCLKYGGQSKEAVIEASVRGRRLPQVAWTAVFVCGKCFSALCRDRIFECQCCCCLIQRAVPRPRPMQALRALQRQHRRVVAEFPVYSYEAEPFPTV